MNKELFEQVCAGLRKMHTKPDYLLCTEQLDIDKISDIPVLYTYLPTLGESADDKECPFYPLWKDGIKDYMIEVGYFLRGFDENIKQE